MKTQALLRSSAISAAFAMMVASFGCEGRTGSIAAKNEKSEPLTGPAVVELNLSGGVSEAGASSLFGPVPGRSYADLVESLRHLDKDTKGIFVRIGTASMPFAEARELGGLLAAIKKSGMPVVCHADEYQNGTILLVEEGCSEIWLSPAGGVETVGIAAQLIFGKSLFQKLDVDVDFLQVGKYKGAEEPFTRDEPSPEARESLEGTLHDLRDGWLAGIAEGRGKDLSNAVEDGPYAADDAKEVGLIDKVGYLDDARVEAKKLANAERVIAGFGGRVEGGGAGDVLRQLAGGDPSLEPHVAVVRAVGAISMGGGGGLLGGNDGITEEGLGKILTAVTNDDSVKAVVLRIDSPGGSALASDLLWHKLMLLRAKKPLIVSVGGMAASGGYYLSCAANRIYAEDTSIVGSIGVVGGKLSFKGPLTWAGVHVVTVPASTDPKKAARASYMSTFDPWDDATRAKVLRSMEAIYDTFLDRVSTGRGIDKTVVASFAEGRIFGGKTAKEKGLVDAVGGLSDAVSYALQQASLPEDGAVVVVAERGGLAALFSDSDGKASESLGVGGEAAVLDDAPRSARARSRERFEPAPRPDEGAAGRSPHVDRKCDAHRNRRDGDPDASVRRRRALSSARASLDAGANGPATPSRADVAKHLELGATRSAGGTITRLHPPSLTDANAPNVSMPHDPREDDVPPPSEVLPTGVLSVDPLPRAEGGRAELSYVEARLADAIDEGDLESERALSVDLARKLAARGTDLDEALRLAERALEIGHDRALASELSGWLGGVGEPTRAAEHLERIAERSKQEKTRARSLMRAAVLRARAGDATKARANLERAADEDKTDAIPHELIGTLSTWSDVPAEVSALAYLEAARRRDAAGDEDAAFEDRLRAFATSPGSPVAAEALADALIARGRPTAADEVIVARAEALPDVARMQVHLGRLDGALERGDVVGAVAAVFDAGIEIGERSASRGPDVETKVDDVLSRGGMFEMVAARYAARGRREAPADARATYEALARLYEGQLGRPDLMVGALVEAIVADPDARAPRAALREHAVRSGDDEAFIEALVRVGLGDAENAGVAATMDELAHFAEDRRADPTLALWAYERSGRFARDKDGLASARARLKVGAQAADAVIAETEASLRATTGTDAASRERRVGGLAKLARLYRSKPDASARELEVLTSLVRAEPTRKDATAALFLRIERRLGEGASTVDLELFASVLAAIVDAPVDARSRVAARLLRARVQGAADPNGRAAVAAVAPLVEGSPSDLIAVATVLDIATRHEAGKERGLALAALAEGLATPIGAIVVAAASEALASAGDAQGALRLSEKASAAAPTLGKPARALAHAAVSAMDRESAAALETALGVLVPSVDRCAALAAALDKVGEPNLAVAWTERWLALRPASREALRELARRAIDLGDAGRLASTLGWILAQPEPAAGLVEPLIDGLRALFVLDAAKAKPIARRSLDVFGPKDDRLRRELLALADEHADRGLAIAAMERWLASATAAPVATLLELCVRRCDASDYDGAARELCRAAHFGTAPDAVLESVRDIESAAKETLSGDGRIWLAEAVARSHWELSNELTRERAIAAFRALGALRWDLAEDWRGSEQALYAASEAGAEADLYARDLVELAGVEQAMIAIRARAKAVDGKGRARVLTAAARQLAENGLDEAALGVAEEALLIDPSLADAIAISEACAHGEAGAQAISRIYDGLANAAMGVYGQRAAHYRAARQLERRGALALAVDHAIASFEAVPNEGTSYSLLYTARRSRGRLRRCRPCARACRGSSATGRARSLAEAGGRSCTRIGRRARGSTRHPPSRAAHRARFEDGRAHRRNAGRAHRCRRRPRPRTRAVRARAPHGGPEARGARWRVRLAAARTRCDRAREPGARARRARARGHGRRRAWGVRRPSACGEGAHGGEGRSEEDAGESRVEPHRRSGSDRRRPRDGRRAGRCRRIERARKAPRDKRRRSAHARLGDVRPHRRRRASRAARTDAEVRAVGSERRRVLQPPTFDTASAVRCSTARARDHAERSEPVARVGVRAARGRASAVERIDGAQSHERRTRPRSDRGARAPEAERQASPSERLRRAGKRAKERPGDAEALVEKALDGADTDAAAAAEIVRESFAPDRAAAFWDRLSKQPSRTDDQRVEFGLRAVDGYTVAKDANSALIVLDRISRDLPQEVAAELRVSAARTASDPLALTLALDDLASTKSFETEKERATVLLEAAQAALVGGDEPGALIRARRAARVDPTNAVAAIEVARLEYRTRGTGTPREAQATVDALVAVESNLSLDLVELHGFLLAEELDVIQGGGAGMREHTHRHAEIGPLPLVALGMAERLARNRSYEAALPLFEKALAGDLRGLRNIGRVAVAAADAAIQAGVLDLGAKLLDEAERYPETKAIVERKRRELDAASPDPAVAEGALKSLIQASSGLTKARFLERLANLREAEDTDAAIALYEEALGPARNDRTLSERIRKALVILRSKGMDADEEVTSTGRRIPAAAALDGDEESFADEDGTPSAIDSTARVAIIGAPPATSGPPSVPALPPPLPVPSLISSASAKRDPRGLPPSLPVPGRSTPPSLEVSEVETPVSSHGTPLLDVSPPSSGPRIEIGDRDSDASRAAAGLGLPPEDEEAAPASVAPMSRVPSSRALAALWPAIEHPTEEDLFLRLVSGEVEAGDTLIGSYDRGRTRDVLVVRRHQATLRPGDRGFLDALHRAAIADGSSVYARAVEHVQSLGAAAPPPPLSAQTLTPALVQRLLFRDLAKPTTEALALVWESGLMRKDAASAGLTGATRVPPGPGNPVSDTMAALIPLFGSRPLYHVKKEAPPQIEVALLSNPAVVYQGDVRALAEGELSYRLAASAAATLPEFAIVAGEPEPIVRQLIDAIIGAFGPVGADPPSSGSGTSRAAIARIGQELWQRVLPPAERRIRALASEATLSYTEARAALDAAMRRAGLFASGDLAVAIAMVLGPQHPTVTAENLGALCSENADVADLVRFALRMEYAEARFQAASAAPPPVRRPGTAIRGG